MRFRNPSRTGGCCDPCSDLNAKIDAVNSTATAALAAANTAIGIANAQAAAAAASAASAASDAASALTQATNAASSASSALAQATAAAGSASSAAADAASALAAVASKVSIRTTTGTFVYSHINATEGEIAVINDAATANSIPARDGSGYIIAETPASGDNSKKAATTAYVDTADSLKIDKLTTANLQAYTHNGATQGEKAIVDGTTGDTIPIRDADGRMQAADPASGDTSTKLATTNWISQTGDSSPNNLVHRSGNETKSGILTLNDGIKSVNNDWTLCTKVGGLSDGEICQFCDMALSNGTNYLLEFTQGSNTGCQYGLLFVAPTGVGGGACWLIRGCNGSANKSLYYNDVIRIGVKNNRLCLLYTQHGAYGNIRVRIKDMNNYNTVMPLNTTNISIYQPTETVDISTYTDVFTPSMAVKEA